MLLPALIISLVLVSGHEAYPAEECLNCGPVADRLTEAEERITLEEKKCLDCGPVADRLTLATEDSGYQGGGSALAPASDMAGAPQPSAQPDSHGAPAPESAPQPASSPDLNSAAESISAPDPYSTPESTSAADSYSAPESSSAPDSYSASESSSAPDSNSAPKSNSAHESSDKAEEVKPMEKPVEEPYKEIDLLKTEDEDFGDRIMEELNRARSDFGLALKRIGDEISRTHQEQSKYKSPEAEKY